MLALTTIVMHINIPIRIKILYVQYDDLTRVTETCKHLNHNRYSHWRLSFFLPFCNVCDANPAVVIKATWSEVKKKQQNARVKQRVLTRVQRRHDASTTSSLCLRPLV